MRILIYTHAFPPMIGGIETITMQLAKGLASQFGECAEVCVVTPGTKKIDGEDKFPFQLVRKPSLAQVARLVWKADILHIAGPNILPLLLGGLFRKQMVVEHHGFQTVCPSGQMVYQPDPSPCPGHFMARRYSACLKCNANNGAIHSFKQWLLTFVRRRLCFAASANVMPTEWLGSIVQLPRTATIHHGLPVKHSASRSRSGKPTIVFQGRLVSTKGVDVLLQAACLVNEVDFKLLIIGDGPERVRLEANAKNLNLSEKVEFLGYLSTEQAETHIAQATAIVMPSLGGEVFGLVALENMQRGKTVIVSAIGALSEVVGDAGLTFSPSDATALADCLRRVLSEKEFSEEIASGN